MQSHCSSYFNNTGKKKKKKSITNTTFIKLIIFTITEKTGVPGTRDVRTNFKHFFLNSHWPSYTIKPVKYISEQLWWTYFKLTQNVNKYHPLPSHTWTRTHKC